MVTHLKNGESLPCHVQHSVRAALTDSPYGPAHNHRFLIKWKDISYLHASWETRQDLEAVSHITLLSPGLMLQHRARLVVAS